MSILPKLSKHKGRLKNAFQNAAHNISDRISDKAKLNVQIIAGRAMSAFAIAAGLVGADGVSVARTFGQGHLIARVAKDEKREIKQREAANPLKP